PPPPAPPPPGSRLVPDTPLDRRGPPAAATRYALLGPASPTLVHVVANGGTLDTDALYIAQALGAAPESRPFEVRPAAPAGLAAAETSAWKAGDVVVVIGTDGLSRAGRARIASFVEAGGGLLLVVGRGVDPQLVRDVLGTAFELDIEAPTTSADTDPRRLGVVDPRHPVFRPFGDLVATFGQVRFTRTALVNLSDPVAAAPDPAGAPHVLARFDHRAPALVEYDRRAGRALILASDLSMNWNDLPRHPGFVPFLQETVRYLAGPGALPPDVLLADVPAGVPRLPGVATDPASGRLLAVNVDARESEPDPLTPDAFLARVGHARAAATGAEPGVGGVTLEAAQSVWWYILLAMVVVLVAEAWLGRTMA
ncbi:MAG: hypothetical protein OXG72_13060, partial [Acidobacteria bacterium]|nr:hypothetical protein [Acidobacteriota bacterium]